MTGRPTNITGSVFAAVRWSIMIRLILNVFNWAVTLVVIRFLAPDDYGVYAIAVAFISFADLFSEMGLAQAIIQRPTVMHAELRSVFTLILLLNIGLWAVLSLTAPIYSNFYAQPTVEPVVRWLSVSFLFAGIQSFHFALMTRAMDFRRRSIIELTAGVSSGVVALSCAIGGLGLWTLVIAALVRSGIGATLSVAYSTTRVLPALNMRHQGALSKFGAIIIIQRVIWWAYSQADVLILGKFLTPQAMGYYSVGMTISTIPQSKVGAILSQISFAGFSRLNADRALLGDYLAKGIRVTSWLAFPTCFGIAAVAPELVHVLLGEKWIEIIPVIQILALMVPFRMINTPVFEALNALGLPQFALRNTIISAIFVIGAIAVAAPSGVIATCLAWLIAMPASVLVTNWISAPRLGVSLTTLARQSAWPFAVSAAMVGLVIVAKRFTPDWNGSFAGLLFYSALGAVFVASVFPLVDRPIFDVVMRQILRRRAVP